MVMEVVHEDMGEASMHCTNHKHINTTPGGICGSCLQEKLGKLVSSSFPVPIFPSNSSPSCSSPSRRSDIDVKSVVAFHGSNTSNNPHSVDIRKSRLGFVGLANKRKKNKEVSDPTSSVLFSRSKSTTAARRGMHFLNDGAGDCGNNSCKRGFWSFLYLSKHSTVRKNDKNGKDLSFNFGTPSSTVSSSVGVSTSSVNGGGGGGNSANSGGGIVVGNGGIRLREQKREDVVLVEENDSSPDDQGKFESKVSRSRSVGCGSRSFSGDLFERISTGFGDCTLRRVESQREGKHPKLQSIQRNGGQDSIKGRVRCGGIFSGFMIASSSSSSSSSLNYVSSSEESNMKGKSFSSVSAHSSMGRVASPHGRSKSWGWAFASPMRAFSKPSSAAVRKVANSKKNAAPNLNAIPSLLAASG